MPVWTRAGLSIIAASNMLGCQAKGPEVLPLKTTVVTATALPELFIPIWLNFENSAEIGKERMANIIKAASDWNNRFGCGRSVTIRPYRENKVETLADGSKDTTLEIARPGLMEIGSEGNAYNITLHTMTHACKPSKPTILSEPLPFRNGKILGFHGLFVLAELFDGRQATFKLIEEGMAERNAAVFPGYIVTHPGFFAIRELTISLFGYSRFPKAHTWTQTSSVPSLVRTALNIPPGNLVSGGDIYQVIEMYDTAWKRAN